MTLADPEPSPLRGKIAFEPWDFEALADRRARDREHDARRLAARRRLLALAKAFVPRAKEAGVKLEARSSLHHPHAMNGNVVRRLWASLIRPKAERRALGRGLGELAKDLDSAHRNAQLQIALDATGITVAWRAHAEAWIDAGNLKKRVEREGPRALVEVLRPLDGYRVRIADWKGEWPCASIGPEGVEEVLGFWVPGEHALNVERVFPIPTELDARRTALEEPWAERLGDELERLLPLYRFALAAAW